MVRIAKLIIAIKAFKKRDYIFIIIIRGFDALHMIDDVMLECRKCKSLQAGLKRDLQIQGFLLAHLHTIGPRRIVGGCMFAASNAFFCAIFQCL